MTEAKEEEEEETRDVFTHDIACLATRPGVEGEKKERKNLANSEQRRIEMIRKKADHQRRSGKIGGRRGNGSYSHKLSFKRPCQKLRSSR